MQLTRNLRLPARQELLFRTLPTLGIVVGFVIAALPFLWMAVSSLGTAGLVIRIGFTWDMFNPLKWSLEPYLIAWKMAGLSRYIQTTTIYAVAVTVLATTTSSLAGYVFGRLRFPARDFLFGLVLATMMIPGSVHLSATLYPHVAAAADGRQRHLRRRRARSLQ